MEGKPEVIADKKQYGELYAILKKPTLLFMCRTHDLFSMMVPDAADYMGRINISDINEGHTCY
uniref:Uncharacterized protein n=1 Tax=Brassica campestris TaxID=3711 RepID=M4CRU8_BRACM